MAGKRSGKETKPRSKKKPPGSGGNKKQPPPSNTPLPGDTPPIPLEQEDNIYGNDYFDVTLKFPKGINVNDAKKYMGIGGIPNDFKGEVQLNITSRNNRPGVDIVAKGTNGEILRFFFDDNKSDITIESISAPDTSVYRRKFDDLLLRQAKLADERGYKRITMSGVRTTVGNHKNYYDNLQRGFIPNSEANKKYLDAANKYLKEKNTPENPVYTIDKLDYIVRTKIGRDYWRENGGSWTGTFNVEAGSPSRTRLKEHMDRKKSKKP